MPKERNPKRDIAHRLWLESKKKRKLKDIAAELEISPTLIAKWKCVDDWEHTALRKIGDETIIFITNKKGGQPGNKNAVGCGAPQSNKNSIKTGEFETIFFDTLEDDEINMIDRVTLDKKAVILHELQLLTVRERRVLKRLESYKARANQTAEVRTSFVIGKVGQTVKTKPIAELILSTEESLTRIQSQKRQYIELLHKIDKAELEVF